MRFVSALVVVAICAAGCTPPSPVATTPASATAAPSAERWQPLRSDTGPDAEAYGRALGYPVGNRFTITHQQNLVGAFSHFDELFPVRVVPRAAAPWRFRRAAAPADIRYEHAGEQRTLQSYLDHNPVTGLLIARDDTILYEHYQYGRGPSDRLVSQSMGKTFIAMLIGIAIGEGAIRSVDDRAEDYVPALKGTAHGAATLRDLLHMATGIRFSEDYSGHDDDEQFETAVLYGDPARDNSPSEALRPFNQRELPPNTRWNYAATNPYVLGLVLRAATGTSVANYLHDKVWSPIGAEADAAWTLDVSGHELTHGFVQATLRDYARFGRLLAHDGQWQGRQVIPKQWVIDATTVASEFLAPGKLIPDAPDFTLGYGYLTWIALATPERRIFALMGTRGQAILVDTKTRLVIVQTAVRKNFVEPWYEFFAVMRGALRYLESSAAGAT